MTRSLQNNVDKNRRLRKWTPKEQIGRVLWALASPAFFLSPRPLWGWRRVLLRWFGARIGAGVHIYPSVRIKMPWHLDLDEKCAIGERVILYALGPIRIGPRATVSQYAHLCAGTHDLEKQHRPLQKSPIVIGADAWIAADAFIGPGVSIGEGAVVGARAVAMKDVKPHTIVAGNPIRVLRVIET